jgi:hypothetical protein
MNISSDKGFNDGLQQRLIEAGYSPQEIKLAATLSEFNAGLQLLNAISRLENVPTVRLPMRTITGAVSSLFQELTDSAKLDPDRIIAAAKIIDGACMGKAKEALRHMTGGGEQPTVGARPAAWTRPGRSIPRR